MLNAIINFIKKNNAPLIIILVSVIFFLAASSFNFFTQNKDYVKWLSPDEAANYNFIKLYAEENRLSFFEKYNLLAADIIHPRGYLSDLGAIKPVSFLGMILIYGKIAGIATSKVIPYLTPLIASIGIIFYYLLIKEVFGKRNALFSALFLASFPPYLYYSARSLFHNVLFAVLALISLYFSVKMASVKKAGADNGEKKNKALNYYSYIYAALAGAFLGLAIITRTAELTWIIPVFFILWLFNIKKAGLIKLIIFMAFLSLSLLPAAYWNKILYQDFWRGGYNEMNQSILNIAGAGKAITFSGGLKPKIIKNSLNEIKNNFFYFGYQPVKSLKMLYWYFAKMFFWLFWPSVLGLLLFLANIKKWRRRHYVYIIAYSFIFIILLFYYGSWDFHDNPDAKSRTIGNSYTRYWLPLYLGVMPLASFFFIKLSNIFKKSFLIRGFRLLLLAVIFFISLKFLIIGGEEGLKQSARKQLNGRLELAEILLLTEPNSVIITQYHDKLFFPERKVIVGLFNDDNMTKLYAVLTKHLPVYYYNFTFPRKDFDYLNSKKLKNFNLSIKPVKKLTKDFTLYRLDNLIKSPNEE